MNYEYPKKPVHKLKSGRMDVSDPQTIYLGYDELSGYDVWLRHGLLKFTTTIVVDLTTALTNSEKSWNDHPYTIRQWIKRALDDGWLDDYFVLYRCDSCGEIFVAKPNIPSKIDALMKPPACPNCGKNKVVGQTTPKNRWDLAQYLTEEWGPSVATAEPTRVRDIELHMDYAEHGYSLEKDKVGIATGDWNAVTKWDGKARASRTIDSTPVLIGNLLKALGFELEWEDEWATCHECYKLMRIVENSYSWQPSYFHFSCGGFYCLECATPEAILEDIEGQTNRALNLAKPIDPEEHGYVLLEDDFERGFHKGQDADPDVIAKVLKKLGVNRFVFMIDTVSQFDLKFSVYIHENEYEKLDKKKWAKAAKNGPSISEGVKHQLRNMPVASGPGIHVSCVCPEGAVTVKVSDKDFQEGHALGIAQNALKEKLERDEKKS